MHLVKLCQPQVYGEMSRRKDIKRGEFTKLFVKDKGGDREVRKG